MRNQVLLKIVRDEGVVGIYRFEDVLECYAGCSVDCDIQLPVLPGHHEVSRHHCLFQINPPSVRLKVLATKNLTSVNNLAVHSTAYDPYVELHDGDEVRMGSYSLQVCIDQEMPEEDGMLAGHAVSAWYR